MSLEDIYSLNIQRICKNDAVLFLWTTMPMLQEALRTIKEWGFTFKTCAFTWVKRNKKSESWFFGLGNYTRGNAELCLLGVKGKGLKRISASVSSVVDSRIQKHSQKPAIVRERIVQLYGDVPRVELFARETTKGWDAIGNELDRKDIRDVIGLRRNAA
jgi:N6-adenosine-specific RNA methylase IME4